MADQKISELSNAGALDGSESVEIVQAGSNVKTTTQDIADLSTGGAVSSVNSQTGAVVLDAGDIGNTPAGGIAATDVQTALNELDTEKAPLASPTFTGIVTTPLIKITSGVPGVGKVLTSDADGDATWETVSGTGDVVGPASTVDESLAVYDDTTGKLLKDGGSRYAVLAQFTTTTSTTNYVGTTSPAIGAYATGQLFQVKIHATSTGAATLNLNTLGARKIFTNATNQAVAGDLVINVVYMLIYDAALDSATGGFLIANGGLIRRLTVAGAFAEQPYFNSSLGYYVFNPQTSTIIPRMYLIPNNPGSGTTSKLELFNTDYQAGSTNYSGLNLFTTSATDEIHIGPNRGGSGARMKMTLGIYQASSLESLTSRIVFNTDNTVDIYSGGFKHRSVSGTEFFGINSAGAPLLSGSAGTAGQVLTSGGSAAPAAWASPAVIQSTTTDTSGATITLNMNNLTQLIHVGTATFATPKTMAMSNATAALAFSFIFEVTDVAAVITVPATWIMQTADFDGVDWTPPATGRFKFIGVYNGTEWYVDANGPYS